MPETIKPSDATITEDVITIRNTYTELDVFLCSTQYITQLLEENNVNPDMPDEIGSFIVFNGAHIIHSQQLSGKQAVVLNRENRTFPRAKDYE